MRTTKLHPAIALMSACAGVAVAGVPEPDNILHGLVCINGVPATDQDAVTVIARATVGKDAVEVGRYTMGDHPGASDCEGGADCYALRIRLESIPAGTTASGNAVALSSAPAPVQLFVKNGVNQEVLTQEISVTQRAAIRKINLRGAPPTADLNNDGVRNLLDHELFVASLNGPATAVSPPCNPADLNGDGHVDLKDAALMQLSLQGP